MALGHGWLPHGMAAACLSPLRVMLVAHPRPAAAACAFVHESKLKLTIAAPSRSYEGIHQTMHPQVLSHGCFACNEPSTLYLRIMTSHTFSHTVQVILQHVIFIKT